MSANSGKTDRLRHYRAKRSASGTPEPFGSSHSTHAGGGGVFVVQKHSATRMHYDFRLEWGPALLSWAVPRGPSLNPSDKRFAVRTEDHPTDYSAFEGVIPEGNYGAGSVIVWDRGLWIPVDDVEAGLETGKLLFDLKGHKLRGRWTLVRTSKTAKGPKSEWLLIKKPDGFADPNGERTPPETSILSGLTVEEMTSGRARSREVRAELEKNGAKPGRVNLSRITPMLCTPRKPAFTDERWGFEVKYDGYRLMAGKRDGVAVLRYRSGLVATRLYPEIALALTSLPYDDFIIDGEIVIFDTDGRTDFGLLQDRAQMRDQRLINRAAIANPTHYVVFDLLSFDGLDLRPLPLVARKHALQKLLPATGPLRYAEHIDGEGEAMLEKAEELGLEGIVGKLRSSPYRGERSEDWLKFRLDEVQDFAVVGWREPDKKSRVGFRSLHLAIRDKDEWVYAGRVGSGFDETELLAIHKALLAMPERVYDFENVTPSNTPHHWVDPELVARVRYLDWKGTLLRQPTFISLVDKEPLECRRRLLGANENPPTVEVAQAPETKDVKLTNLDKLFWPEDGYTKGDLVDYYRGISPWAMPYLVDRPVVLTRYPNGIHGKSFFQKDAPEWSPDWVRRETMWSEHGRREIHYFICESEEALVYLANLGTIPLHIWSSRTAALQRPDWSILDLDPKGAPFSHVVACARAIHDLCAEIGLPTYVKTSGSTGLHVLIPLGGQCTYEQSKALAEVVSKIIADERRDIATITRSLLKREGKVYLDYIQNGHGRLLVAPFSVRPLPGAPVSMPLSWREVTPSLDISRFHIRNAAARMKRLKVEPLLPVLHDVPDLMLALEQLSARLR